MDPNENGHFSDYRTEKPLRSILRPGPPRPIPSRFTVHPPSGPRIHIHEQAHPNHPILDVSEIVVPTQGPTPGFYLPPMASAEDLERFTFQIAAKLRTQRLEDEEARRVEEAHRPPPLPRPTGKSEEFREFSVILMGQWVPGPDMGPVLSPRHAMTLGPITVNPMLAFPFTDQRRLRWDVRLSFEDAKYITLDRQVSISLPNARLQPATAPRITRLSIISESFPWSLTVNARTASAGVTVFDVLHNVSRFLRLDLADRDLRDTSPAHRAAVIEANRTRTSQSMGPGNIRLLDWLLSATKFGGLAHKPDHVSTSLLASEEAFFVLYFEE